MNAASARFMQRKDIDVMKWDECIRQAANGLIYAYSFYLDKMAKKWDALVMDDYKAVMPLTWNKKYGFHYLYQPAFTPSLGLFGNDLTESLVDEFIHSIPKRFRLIEINLNAGNVFAAPSGLQHLRNNYVLDLNRSYEDLHHNYRENIKRNIKKCIQYGCRVEKNLAIEKVIELAKLQLRAVTNLKNEDLENFKSLYAELASTDKGVTYGILHNEELVASAAYLFSNGRAYYILVGNHPNGKTMGASHYLIDRFIYDHAGQLLLLDFEGSDIRNLAFFYSSFGANLEQYPAISINRLPWYASWLKS